MATVFLRHLGRGLEIIEPRCVRARRSVSETRAIERSLNGSFRELDRNVCDKRCAPTEGRLKVQVAYANRQAMTNQFRVAGLLPRPLAVNSGAA